MGADNTASSTGFLQRALQHGPELLPFATAAVLVVEHIGGSYWYAYPDRAYNVLDGVGNGGILLTAVLVLLVAGKPAWKWLFAAVALLATFRLGRILIFVIGLILGGSFA